MPVLLMQSKSLLASYPLRLLLVNLRDYYTQNNMTNGYDEQTCSPTNTGGANSRTIPAFKIIPYFIPQ